MRYNSIIPMAEKPPTRSGRTDMSEFFVWIFILFLLLTLLGNFAVWLNRLLGKDTGAPGIGSPALTLRDTDVFESAGGSFKGLQTRGARGTVIGGPEEVDGETWWEIDFKDPPDGWVRADDFSFPEAGALGVGSRVRADGAQDIFDTPKGSLLGTQASGARGTIIGGPEDAGGETWWNTDFAFPPDGWLPESGLKSIASLSSLAGIGDPVEFLTDARMYASAGAERLLGLVKKGARGLITGGPVDVGGISWWRVAVGGVEGWVREDVLSAVTGNGTLGDESGEGSMSPFLRTLLLFSYFFSALFGAVALYSRIKAQMIFAAYTRRLNAIADAASVEQKEESSRFDDVLTHVEADTPAHWRLAIIEADILLDEALKERGFLDASLADKLKQLTRGDLASLDKAWEAHKVRNQIAHTGSDFILTQREARRIVGLYEEVLRELEYL